MKREVESNGMDRAMVSNRAMMGLQRHLTTSLKLHLRNRMALVYGYLFPTVFLVAFWVLYRYEHPILSRHLGELLTVTALGGACFGLPTGLVSERERGVWRRYRLAPVSTGSLVASTLLSRYLLLVTAALLQIALAMGIGMPLPAHPLELWVAFTFVAFAFLGLGLVIATMADTVPAVQALGQVIFLPMLVIGGVAVRLSSLPLWAQHVSAFFPGRYAVQAIQACVTGDGLAVAGFSLLALALIGAAGLVVGTRLFRWEAEQRFAARRDRGWVGAALAAWVLVGLLAEGQGIVSTGTPLARGMPARAALAGSASAPARPARPSPAGSAVVGRGSGMDTVARATPALDTTADSATRSTAPGGALPAQPSVAVTAAVPAESWQAVAAAQITDELFQGLPPDEDVISPVASADESLIPEVRNIIDCTRSMLPRWAPAHVADPVQRARNYLYIAAVPDIFQMLEERWMPLFVFERLPQEIPKDQLVKVLYWIAAHPEEGDVSAASQVGAVCVEAPAAPDPETLRERTRFYALKLLGRLTDRIPTS